MEKLTWTTFRREHEALGAPAPAAPAEPAKAAATAPAQAAPTGAQKLAGEAPNDLDDHLSK